MSTDFINYAQIITIALNSVASRFIALEYHRGNKDEALKFYNSTLWSNVFIAFMFMIVGAYIVINLENLINVDNYLLYDVKILFSLIFFNFFITLVCSVFSVGAYVTNSLYLTSLATAVGNLLRIIAIFVLFQAFDIRVWVLGIGSCITSLMIGLSNCVFCRKLVPDLKINFQSFSLSYTFFMLKSGIWSSVTHLSNIIQDGLDLLVSNLLLSTLVMGQISLAKTAPSLMASLISTLSSLFIPNFVKLYAKNRKVDMVYEIKLAMKFTGFIASVVFCVFIVLGESFFELWVPSQDTNYIYKLSAMCVLSVVVSGVVSPLNSIFVVVNKLKINALVWLGISGLDLCLVFLCLRYTEFGGLAVVGISSLTGIVASLTYLPLIISKYLDINIKEIYSVILRYIIAVLIGLIIISFISYAMQSVGNTWISFIAKGFLFCLTMILNNYFVLLKKAERKIFIEKILNKFRIT